LDIGWVLKKTNSKRRKEHDRQIYKQCMGVVSCINNNCPFFGKEKRPAYTDELTFDDGMHAMRSIYEMGKVCSQSRVLFQLRAKYLHNEYLAKHLTEEQRLIIDAIVKDDPIVAPGASINGITRKTSKINKPVETHRHNTSK
jgi:hypothetical protein